MNNIIAFGASNSSKSINQKLARWVSGQLENTEVTLLDLNDYEMPIYSIDREQKYGVPQKAHQFKKALKGADGIIISFAEHNGSYTAAFKNILDWVSRIERTIWLNKPMFLLATSPGPRGAIRILSSAQSAFPYQGGQVEAIFSLPSFKQNFDSDQGIMDPRLKTEFEKQLANFQSVIHKRKTELSPTKSQ